MCCAEHKHCDQDRPGTVNGVSLTDLFCEKSNFQQSRSLSGTGSVLSEPGEEKNLHANHPGIRDGRERTCSGNFRTGVRRTVQDRTHTNTPQYCCILALHSVDPGDAAYTVCGCFTGLDGGYKRKGWLLPPTVGRAQNFVRTRADCYFIFHKFSKKNQFL